jgi:hypothetical protein
MPSKTPTATNRKHRQLKGVEQRRLEFWLPHWAVRELDRLAHMRGESRASLVQSLLIDPRTYELVKPKKA